jgi:D-serine deaminase-like pyridoxal phosphate-dependent protein
MNDSSLPSPSFCVDLDIVEANTSRMLALAAAAGVSLRPHVKTHKTLEGALLSCGVTDPALARIVVSTLAEAEFFVARGVGDVLYGVPLEPSKLPRAAALACSPRCLFSVMVDGAAGVSMLRAHPLPGGAPWRVFLAVDATGYAREGAAPEVAEALAADVARGGGGVELAGLYSHSGNSYSCGDGAAGAARVALMERDVMAALAARLRAAGVAVPAVSVGATPSAACGGGAPGGWAGVTELHPGNHVFFDRQQVASGSCGVADIAVHVVGRVVSLCNGRGEALVDVGATALHKDAAGLADWGELRGRPGVVVKRLTQELAVLGSAAGGVGGAPLGLALGDVVRILPNHACMTASGHWGKYHVLRGGKVVGEWVPCTGW